MKRLFTNSRLLAGGLVLLGSPVVGQQMAASRPAPMGNKQAVRLERPVLYPARTLNAYPFASMAPTHAQPQRLAPALPHLALLPSPVRAQASQLSTASEQVTQEWVARYDTQVGPRSASFETARDVAVDAAGNVYVTGIAYVGQLPPDWLTIKYSPSGQQLWVARYNGPATGPDEAQALAVDAAGNVYVTGYSNGNGTNTDYTTIKYSTQGQQLWEARYDGPASSSDEAEDIALDAAGNIYVTGYSTGDVAGYATVKYSPSGQQLWVARYDRPGQSGSFAEDLAVDAAGNVAVTGYSYGDDRSSGADYATVKYSTDGQQLWEAVYNGPDNGFDQAQAVGMDAAGNVFVTGFVLGPEPRAADYATLKYSPQGQLLWTALYNGPGSGNDTARDLAVDGAGNVIVTGMSQGSSTRTDYATLKYSPAGQQLWEARYDGPLRGDDGANALALDAAGNAYVTGSSGMAEGSRFDYATLKYSPSGQQLWVVRYNGPLNDSDGASALALDARGNVYVTGNSIGCNATSCSQDYATIKYSQSGVGEPSPGCNRTANQPVATPDFLAVNAGALTFTRAQLLANDRDPLGRPLQVASVGKPSAGTLVSNADGTFTYHPWPGFVGTATFTYLIQETGPVLASSGTGHYYEFVSAPGICWADAQAAASARRYHGMQGYLATITFAGEKDFLVGRAQGQYWFGASDAGVEGEWRWQTGPEAGQLIWRGGPNGIGAAYNHWLPGQPDDYKNQWRPQGEDYAQLYGNSGFWNDVDNCNTGGTTAGYVVEYGGLEACLPILYSLGTVSLEVRPAPAARQAAAPPAETAGHAQLQAAPNPSTGQFRVQVLAGREGPAQLDLFDLQGRRVRSLFTGSLQAGEQREVPVDAQELSAGLYLLRLQSGQQVQHLRLLIQK